MSARKLYPEIELQPLVLETVRQYIGPRRLSKLSTDQRAMLSEICGETGKAVARALREPDQQQ